MEAALRPGRWKKPVVLVCRRSNVETLSFTFSKLSRHLSLLRARTCHLDTCIRHRIMTSRQTRVDVVSMFINQVESDLE